MSGYRVAFHRKIAALLFCVVLLGFVVFSGAGTDPGVRAEEKPSISDHYDGRLFFNPDQRPGPSAGSEQKRRSGWIWRWIFGNDRPEWPELIDRVPPGGAPPVRVPKGSLLITPVGHATFLIQMDRLNLLTDPIWSERCSPVSWAGPKRYREPGIRFEDLPPIDAVLVSHNHYDHLDLPTLERLAGKGARRCLTTLGNRDLIRGAGIPDAEEFDWWQQVRLSDEVTVTVVPAQHFSSRSLWDRNETLWGGFVISGPSGNLFFAGDTGYGPHLREIARRFSPIRAALLPIAPFRPPEPAEQPRSTFLQVHMGPAEAVQAHLDLQAGVSIAAHFQVFQLGWDAFDDAPRGLRNALVERGLPPDAFIAPLPGRFVALEPSGAAAGSANLLQPGRQSVGMR
ncbi:MAG: MBL fold metallo-hydrolase [Deltaproteobacteria bacterium]|nr:MBL fold metallo-hydrolase [Deltaproteobacteria bacterium]